MARVILATNASHDSPTEYLGAWFEKLLDAAQKEGDVVIFELKKEKANRAMLEKAIEEEKPSLVIINGHGSPEVVCGYNFEVLIKYDDNHKILAGKIVHALSCSSGKVLGPECVRIGSLAYMGYKDEFKLATLGKKDQTEQRKDPVAGLFLDPAFETMISLIEGQRVEDAYKRSQEMGKKNLRILLTSKNPKYNTTVASLLYHNLINQVSLGNQSAAF